MRLSNLLVLLIISTFVLNVSIVGAWAHSCPKDNSIQAQDEMPCENHTPTKKADDPCQGLCLCLHVMSSHNFTVGDLGLSLPVLRVGPSWDIVHDDVQTLALKPHLQPPQIYS